MVHSYVRVRWALPDCALRVKALSKMTKQVLQGHSEIAFRISLVRAELQVDLTPTEEGR